MVRSRLVCICTVLLCVLAFSSLPAWGQATSTGTIVGTVTDNTGAVVAGATVTAIDKATGDTRTTTTNDVGHYIFQNINPSSYVIKFKKAGFAETDVTGATVTVGTQLTENVQMKLGSISTTVTVTETAGAELQTMNSTIGNTISGTSLSSLPALGRDATSFVTLQPGVSPNGSVAGTVVDNSTFTLDGGQNTNDMDGSMNVYTPSYADDPTGGVMGGGPTGVMPTPIDSIEEFKVNTANQTADFDNSSGAQVEMVTKRGTNNWHGTAYEYYLDNNFNANSWDNNNSDTARPSYHYNRFGFAGGGPIIPKVIAGGKTYFFANFEGFRYPQSVTFARSVPSPDMRAGKLTFSGTTYDVSQYDPRCIAGGTPGVTCGINPVVATMWNTYEPAGTSEGCNQVGKGSRCDGVNEYGFVANMPLPETSNFGVTRVDHDFGSKWHFNSTYHYYNFKREVTNQVDIGGALPGDTLGTPVSVANRPQQAWMYTAGLTTNISGNVTNDFHYSYLRNYWAWASVNAPPQPGTGSTGVLEPFGETGTGVLAPYNVDTQEIRQRFWDGQDNFFRDDITVLHGNHLFQFGGQFQHNFDYHQRTDNGGGINNTLTYLLGDSSGAGNVNLAAIYANGFAGGASSSTENRDLAAVLGIVTDSQVVYTRQGAALNIQPLGSSANDKSTINYYNVYFSDSWHVKPSLTLTYGLGYTLEMPPTEAQGKQVEVVDSSGQLLDTMAYLNQRKLAALQGQVYNPEVGYALVGNTGAGRKYPYNPFYGSFSPRISAAWNPSMDSSTFMGRLLGGNSTVIRGGYSRIYGRLNGVDQVLVPLLGTGLMQPVSCKLALSSGACGPTTPDATTAFRIGIDGNTAPLPQATPTLPQPLYPGFNNVSAAAGEGFDPSFRPNAVDSFDLSIQRQFGPKMMLEVGYIGRRITHEYQPININAVPYMMTMGGQSFAQAYAAVETALGCATSITACGANPSATVPSQPFFEAALAGTGYCTGYTNCTDAFVANEGPAGTGNLISQSVWTIWNDLDQGGIGGGPGGATTPGFNFPRSMLSAPIGSTCVPGSLPGSQGTWGCSGQMSGGVGQNGSFGWGNYNGAFVTFKTTDWHGITSQQNFAWSKTLGTGAFVQASSEYTADDPFNIGTMYGRQAFDNEKVYNLYISYTPTIYKGQQGLLGRVLGGWSFAPIFTAGTGGPQNCYTANGQAEAFGAGVAGAFFDNEQCIFTTQPKTGVYKTFTPASGGNAAFTTVNRFADPTTAMADSRPPILGIDTHDNGTGSISYPGYWNLSLQVTKDIRLTERFSIETQLMMVNVFNHPVFDSGSSDPMDYGALDSWGDITNQTNQARRLELGARINF